MIEAVFFVFFYTARQAAQRASATRSWHKPLGACIQDGVVEENGALSDNKYEFRKHRCGRHKSRRWHRICMRRIISGYVSMRKLRCFTCDGWKYYWGCSGGIRNEPTPLDDHESETAKRDQKYQIRRRHCYRHIGKAYPQSEGSHQRSYQTGSTVAR